MSILIEGMEMPINCDSCRIMVLEDTNCDSELFCGCPLVFKAHPQGEDHRPDYCPLVELPSHGRLVDADAVMLHIQDYIEEYDDDLSDSGYHSEKWCAMKEAEMVINDAPTIIEAEEEGE